MQHDTACNIFLSVVQYMKKKKELADRYKNKFLRLSHNDPKPLDDNINRNGMIV